MKSRFWLKSLCQRLSSSRLRCRDKRRNALRATSAVEQLDTRVLLSAMSVSPQFVSEEVSPGVVILQTEVDATTAGKVPQAIAAPAGSGLQFNLIPAAGMSQQAIDGFQAAADLWKAVLHDDIVVNLNIDFSALGAGILGSTSSTTQASNYTDFRAALAADSSSPSDQTAVANLPGGSSLSLYTSDPTTGAPFIDNNGTANNNLINLNTATAKAVGILAANDSVVDGSVSFSTLFTWDFDRSNGISGDAYDFVGVAAHEIGHALGFRSGADSVDYYSKNGPGAPLSLDPYRVVTPLDLFRRSASSESAGTDIDIRADTDTKYFSIDGGATSLTTFSTGRYNGDGRQASHWKDSLGIGIMDPTSGQGEMLQITNFDVQAFDVIGWNTTPVIPPGIEVNYHVSPHPYESLDLELGQPGVFLIHDGSDDASTAIDIGSNTFSFYGTNYTGTSIYVSTNGLITFDAANNLYQNTDFTSNIDTPAIAALWDDFRTDIDSMDMVIGKIDGNRLIVEWSQVHTFSASASTMTYQAILQLNTGNAAGDIVLNYVDTLAGNSRDNGASATVGIKPAINSPAPSKLVSFNAVNPLVGSGEAIRFSVDKYTASAYPYEAVNLEPGQPGVVTVVDNTDDGGAAIDLGSNTFTFYGVTYTGANLFANANGLLTFGSAVSTYTNADLSANPTVPTIAPYWDDLRLDQTAEDMILAKIDGNRLIIEWSQARTFASSTSPITFQAILQLNTGSTSGDIVFNYVDTIAGNASDNGASATIGVKPANDLTSNSATLVSYNATSSLVGSGKAILLAVDHALQMNGGVLTVNGTAQDDSFVVTEGATVGVTYNGVPYRFNAGLSSIIVHGNSGNDTLSFSGTPGDDTVTLRPRTLIATGSGYSFQADSMETIRVYSAGGANDVANIFDSAGADTLISRPTYSQMTGPGYFNYVSNFDKVYTYATNPTDRAYLYDSAGNDTLTSTPLYSLMKSTAYYNYSQGFKQVYAYASTGVDTASLYDSSGNDTFIAAPTYVQMIGANYSNYATGFDQAFGYATAGNAGGVGDIAKMFDSAGNDVFVARPAVSQMSGVGYMNQASGFGHVYGYSTPGPAEDRAYLYDSAGNDTFYGTPTYAQMWGTGYFNYASKFDKVYAYASTDAGGVGDQANLLDSIGNDTFFATPTYAQLSGPGYFNYVSKFDKVQAFASTNAGGTGDRANMYDSAGNDTFVGTPTYGLMKGSGFYNYAQGFTQVSGYATSGGDDTANLYDSAGNDSFYGRSNYARLTGTGFYNYASGFSHVNAYANAGGFDTLDVRSFVYDFKRFGSWESIL